MSDDVKILRSSKRMAVILTVATLGLAAGSVVLYRNQGVGFQLLFLAGLAVLCVFGVVESLLTRVELHSAEMFISQGWRNRRIPKSQVESVTWEGGVGVSVKLVSGDWVRLPAIGNSQARTNSIRAWLKR